MKIIDLRNIVQNNFNSVDIIKENLNHTIEIIEDASNTALKKVLIKNTPTQNIWIFENEKGESFFRSQGLKVEKTILYLNDNRLYIILIELKETANCKSVKHTIGKYRESLEHIFIYLLINNHTEAIHKDIEIFPIGVMCYNDIDDYNKYQDCPEIIDEIKANQNKYILKTIQTTSASNITIPTIYIQNSEVTDSFSIDFKQDIINLFYHS